MIRRWAQAGVLATALAVTSSARADDDAAADPTPSPTATLASVFPGVILHGSGAYVAKQQQTARRLLLLEGAGVLLTGGALVGLATTGASRKLVVPFATMAVTGVGLFLATFLVDVYGVATPASARGEALHVRPTVTTESGIVYRYDPQFPGRALFSEGIDTVIANRHALYLSMQATPGDPSMRVRGIVAERFLRNDRDNSFLDLEGGVTHLRFPVDGFYSTTFEAALRGRLDLQHVGPSLRGAFAESRIGAGMSALRTRDVATDADDLLLLRNSVGAYLGQGRGEVELSYDHRRDTLAGGLLVPGIPAGYAGFLGARMRLFFGSWGFQTEVQAGSAMLAGFSFLMRTEDGR